MNENAESQNRENFDDLIENLIFLKKRGWIAWAKKNASELRERGVEPDEIKRKFIEYDTILENVEKIEQQIPSEKRSDVLKFIFQKLNEKTDGHGREMKKEMVSKISNFLEKHLENQNLTRFSTAKNFRVGSVEAEMSKILDAENQKEYQKWYEKIFTQKFWKAVPEMSPMDFPGFTASFNFRTQTDFLQNFTLDSIQTFPELLRASIIADAEGILREFFGEKEKSDHLKNLKSISEKNPEKLLRMILKIREKSDRNRTEAKEQIARAKRFFLECDPRAAKSELENCEKKYGKNIFNALCEQKFCTTVEVRIARIAEIEKKLKTEKSPTARAKLLKKMNELDAKKSKFTEESTESEKKERIRNITDEIAKFRQHGDLKSARNAARRLRKIDRHRADRETEKIDAEMQKKTDADEQKETSPLDDKTEMSVEKAKKIEFLEKCIEHARRVKEECRNHGIPIDSPDFWKQDGIKNRVKWLKDHNLWKKYCLLNSRDRNMPKDSQGGSGFKFRWLDNRGNDLNYSRAETGLRYLNRYRESGYTLATLGAAFSSGWKSTSSPVFTPDEFIEDTKSRIDKIKSQ